MARMARNTLRKAKPSSKRISYTEAQLVNAKYLGKNEPNGASSVLTSAEYTRMLNWYNYMSSVEEARGWLIEYLETLDRSSDVEALNKLPLHECSPVAGHVARIILRGYVPPTDSLAFIDRHVATAVAKIDQPSANDNVEPSYLDGVDKESRLLMLLEQRIGKAARFDVAAWFVENKVNSVQAKMIAEYWRPVALKLAAEYKKSKSKDLLARLAVYSDILKACDGFEVKKTVKAARKPRAKRPVSIEKKLKLVKWQQNSAEFGISSVDPSKIIGASEVVLFNTKWNVITILRGKLDINRTTIVGYDESRSESKRIGRGAKQKLADLARANTKRIEKILGDIDTAPVDIKDRFNENVIIVKVIN